MLPTPEPGDIVAIPAAGAYCPSMASNYNLNPRPPMVLVNNGQSRLIRRRESYQDMMLCDVDVDFLDDGLELTEEERLDALYGPSEDDQIMTREERQLRSEMTDEQLEWEDRAFLDSAEGPLA
jgi:hypothetical protein